MATFSPLAGLENAAGNAILELIKLVAQDRRDFEKVFKDTLAAQLEDRGNVNQRMVDNALDDLLGDPDVQKWLEGEQLPKDLPLAEALAGKLKLDVLLVRDFFRES